MTQPSPMERSFIEAAKIPYHLAFNKTSPFQETFYFFYGPLMDPETLAAVLGRSPNSNSSIKNNPPQMQQCYIVGYHTKLWDNQPALLDGPQGHRVYGKACKIKTQDEMDKLDIYGNESNNYVDDGCIMYFEDGSRAFGCMFGWQGDLSLLREDYSHHTGS